MGCPRESSDAIEAILAAGRHVAEAVVGSPLARVALKLQHRRDVRARTSVGGHGGWLARISDYLEEATKEGVIDAEVVVACESRLIVGGLAGLVGMAIATEDYRHLIDDSVSMVTDRVSRLVHTPANASLAKLRTA